jgi:hypothetical protein
VIMLGEVFAASAEALPDDVQPLQAQRA